MKMAYDLETWHKHKQIQLISQVRFALFPFGKYIIMHLVGVFELEIQMHSVYGPISSQLPCSRFLFAHFMCLMQVNMLQTPRTS